MDDRLSTRPPPIANQGTFGAKDAPRADSQTLIAPAGLARSRDLTSLRLPYYLRSSSARRLNSPDAAGCFSTYSVVKELKKPEPSGCRSALRLASPAFPARLAQSPVILVLRSGLSTPPNGSFFGSFAGPLPPRFHGRKGPKGFVILGARLPFSKRSLSPNSRRKTGIRAWSRAGSNRQPPGCKPGALPVELRPRTSSQLSALSFQLEALEAKG